MDEMELIIEQVLAEVETCVRQTSAESLSQARVLIGSASLIYVAGAGRSGLCMRALGMRLMHLGKTVYVVGETTTPSISGADLLIIGSGSGRTASMLTIAGQARRKGANILLFTTDGTSPLAELADHTVVISAPSYRSVEKTRSPITVQPLGTLFEQSMLILCDALILGLMQQWGVRVEQMLERHANLE